MENIEEIGIFIILELKTKCFESEIREKRE